MSHGEHHKELQRKIWLQSERDNLDLFLRHIMSKRVSITQNLVSWCVMLAERKQGFVVVLKAT